MSETRGLVERVLHVRAHGVEQLGGGLRITHNKLPCELDVHGECNETLLHAVVELAFEIPSFAVVSEREPTTRRTELVDLET